MQTVLCLVDLGFAAGESPTHKLAAVFQIVNALAHPADIGVVVRQQKRGIRHRIFAPVIRHRGLQSANILVGQAGTALQGLVLAVIGIDAFHGGLQLLQPRQFLFQLFHGKVIVGADPACTHRLDLIQQLLNFHVLAHIAVTSGVLLFLFAYREITAPGDQNGRHTAINDMGLVEVGGQLFGVAVNQRVDLVMVHGIDTGLLAFRYGIRLIHHLAVGACSRTGLVVGKAVHILCPLCRRLIDFIILRHSFSFQNSPTSGQSVPK